MTIVTIVPTWLVSKSYIRHISYCVRRVFCGRGCTAYL